MNTIESPMEGHLKFAIKRERNSNLELFRIIIMLLIVSHHYVVNSGITNIIEKVPNLSNTIFYLLLGAWGKTGINCFVMITGWFMCKSCISLRKFLKLLLWILFYNIIITAIFSFSNNQLYSLYEMWISAIPLQRLDNNFPCCFLVFYLFIPFINKAIRTFNKLQHKYLILLLLFVYTIHTMVPGFRVSMNYISWFFVLYLIAAYLRFYPSKYSINKNFWGAMTILSWGASVLSILLINHIQILYGLTYDVGLNYTFLFECNDILALTNGITSFMWFKNLEIKNSKIINTIAASSFGVLLIHANSNTMRQWLWKDTIDCVGHYDVSYYRLYAIGCIFTIYAVCTIIDIIRIKTIETPLINITEKACIRVWKSAKNKLHNY